MMRTYEQEPNMCRLERPVVDLVVLGEKIW